ncbi:MAG: translation initiation factor IF-3 [Patescibacteria group bacterium]|nr:translation initiation factor IF-3 [Patescibacteria group bacterium]
MGKQFSRNQSRINEQIQAEKVRLINSEKQQVGIIDRLKALSMAKAEGLDLVEIAPDAKPPVVQIMNYGKHQYNKKKQERKGRVKSRKNEIKGVRLRIKTDSHDMEVKQKRVFKFLKKGYKVSVEIVLKGREKIFFDKAREVLENFIKSLEPSVSIDQPIKKSPNGFNAIIKNAE